MHFQSLAFESLTLFARDLLVTLELRFRRFVDRCICKASVTALIFLLMGFNCQAQESPRFQPDLSKLPTRELLVPASELQVLLSAPNERVIMTRAEYEKLLRDAKVTPEAIEAAKLEEEKLAKIPTSSELLSATHLLAIESGRVAIESEYQLELFKDTWTEVPLDFSNVQLLSATLDNETAWLRKLPSDSAAAVLVCRGKGLHSLKLRSAAIAVESSAQQSIGIVLPSSSTTNWSMQVPGNVEVLTGAEVLSREVVSDANLTKFRLVPSFNPASPNSAALNLTMTLNNRLAKEQSLVDVRSQQMVQIASSLENLGVLFELRVLQGGESEFTAEIPDGFEIQSVQSPWMARWGIENPEPDQADQAKRLLVEFREPVTDQATITVKASRTKNVQPNVRQSWRLPTWKVLGVSRHDSLVTIGLSEMLRWSDLQSDNLIPVKLDALPSLAEPLALENSEIIRPIFAGYAPGSRHQIQASLERVQSKPRADVKWVMEIGQRELKINGSIQLSAAQESLDRFDLKLPKMWRLQTASDSANRTVIWEKQTIATDSDFDVITLKLQQLLRPNQSIELKLELAATPEGWLSVWQENRVDFPRLDILNVESRRTILSASARDDLTLEEAAIGSLDPLLLAERNGVGLQASSVDALAYLTLTDDWKLSVLVKRLEPTLIAEAVTYASSAPSGLKLQHEILIKPERAKVDQVLFNLPETTPAELSIRFANGVAVKSYFQTTADGIRTWTVKLPERTIEPIRLKVDYRLPTVEKEFLLPVPKVLNAAYQSGLIAVDRDDAMEVSVRSQLRRADIGEMTDSSLTVGASFLGVFGYAAFQDTQPEVWLKSVMRELGYIPTTIVESMMIRSWLSNQQWSYHQASYGLKSSTSKVAVRLPEELEIWAVTVDDKAALPQRDGDLVIIELPMEEAAQSYQVPSVQVPSVQLSNDVYSTAPPSLLRRLVITYAIPIAPLNLKSTVSLAYPELVHRTSNTRIPVSNINWTVFTPSGYQLTEIEDGIASLERTEKDFPWNIGRRLVGIQLPRFSPFFLSGNNIAEGRQLWEEQVASQPSSLLRQSGSGMSAGQMPPAPLAEEAGINLQIPQTAQAQPQVQSEAAVDQAAKPAMKRKLTDAKRSLQVTVDSADLWNQTALSGFDALPSISLNVVQTARWKWLAGTTGCLVFALFVSLWTKSVWQSWRTAILIAGLSIIVALVVPTKGTITDACEMAFWAATGMFSLRLIIAMAQILSSKKVTRVGVSAMILLIVSFSFHSSTACWAQQTTGSVDIGASETGPANEIRTVEQMLAALRKAANDDKPVLIPMNAIVVPYSSDVLKTKSSNEKILVPLRTFEYLNTIVAGNAKSSDSSGPLTYGSMSYKVVLDGVDSVVLEGTVSVLNSSKEAKPIPLSLSGAVLMEATLEKLPASVFASGENLVVNVPPMSQPQVLQVKIQTKISTQAGWQSIQATIPSTAATRLSATVPSKDTEVRWSVGNTQQQLVTSTDAQQIEIGLAAGQLALQWRPKITQVVTDQSLQAQITSTVSLLENEIAADNEFQFSFRRGRRDEFLIVAPEGYRVERVVGDNIKSWKLEPSSEGQQIRVTLLKTAVEAEKLRVQASRQIDLLSVSEQDVAVPSWKIPDASVTRGQIQLLATNKLSASIRNSQGLTREDVSSTATANQHPTAVAAISAYRYATTDYQLSLAVKRVETKFDAASSVDLFVYRSQYEVESTFRLGFLEGEASQIQLSLPPNWKWELDNGSVKLELEVKPENEGRVEAIVRSVEPIPKQAQFSIRGRLARDAALPLAGSEVDLPEIRILGASTNRCNLRVWADRGLEAVVSNLSKLTQLGAQRGQFHRSRDSMESKVILQYLSSSKNADQSYSGRVGWQSRRAIVDTVSVCNAKLTKQSIEQTIYIEWLIREAGIAEVSFVLPATMKQANIAAQMARSITKQPLNQDSDSPIRVTIALQDQILGEYRVLVQNDLPWSDIKSAVPLVSGMTGNVRHQFVTLENSGFDEMTIDSPVGMQALVRGDSYWNEFSKILGNDRVQAYRIDDKFNDAQPFTAEQPKLTFATRSRSTVQTANAKIGLATTQLSVDEQGNYRGTVEFRMENFSEPYLEIELPSDSQLWTIYVAGAPVKPGKSTSTPTNAQSQRYRIPLVRTQLGDLDYEIRLIYAGKISVSRFWSAIQLPFVKSINVQPEQSQLRLHLPESFRWYRWEGTMGLVNDEQDLTAGWLSYRNDQLMGLSSLLSKNSSDEFSQSRAVENIKRLKDSVQQEIQSQQSKGVYNEKLQEQVGINFIVVEEATRQQSIVEQNDLKVADDNRSTLGNLFMQQSNRRANGNKYLEQKSDDAKQEMSKGESSLASDKPLSDSKSNQQLSDPFGVPPSTPQQQAALPAPAINFNSDRQQSDAKQLAQRYKNKIQSQNQDYSSNSAQQMSNLSNRADVPFQGGQFPPSSGAMSGPGDMSGMNGNVAPNGMRPMGGGMGGMAGGMGGMGGGVGGMGGGGFGGGAVGGGRGGSAISNSFPPNLALATSAPQTNAPSGPGGQMGQLGGLPLNQGGANDLIDDFYGSNETGRVPAASGMRSLDVQVPIRGKEYLFVTPKGEMRLVAHGISMDRVRDWGLALGTLLTMILLTRRWWLAQKS